MNALKWRASAGQVIDSDRFPDLRPIASFISMVPSQTGHVGDVVLVMMNISDRL